MAERDLTIIANVEGHTVPVLLERDEHDVWLASFRSTFGPKRALVEELRRERLLEGYPIKVSYDRSTVTFLGDGRVVHEEY